MSQPLDNESYNSAGGRVGGLWARRCRMIISISKVEFYSKRRPQRRHFTTKTVAPFQRQGGRSGGGGAVDVLGSWPTTAQAIRPKAHTCAPSSAGHHSSHSPTAEVVSHFLCTAENVRLRKRPYPAQKSDVSSFAPLTLQKGCHFCEMHPLYRQASGMCMVRTGRSMHGSTGSP